MRVKGFLLEDDAGREFVVVCAPPDGQRGKAYALRGWQRRRMVPLQWTGSELRHITGGVRSTLINLVQRLSNVSEDV